MKLYDGNGDLLKNAAYRILDKDNKCIGSGETNGRGITPVIYIDGIPRFYEYQTAKNKVRIDLSLSPMQNVINDIKNKILSVFRI